MMDDSAAPGQATDRRGLCVHCAHVRLVEGRGASVFYLCERSFADPRFPRYPTIPVLGCPGFEPRTEDSRPPG